MSAYKYIAAADADGTLLTDSKTVSQKDMETLKMLGEMDICRVIVTGRTIWSFTKKVGADFPIEYLAFSCGAGVMDWKRKKVIYKTGIDREGINFIKGYLDSINADFFIQDEIPDNHYFYAYSSGKNNPDFERRCASYKNFRRDRTIEENASQFLAVFPDTEHEAICREAKKNLSGYKIIRSTSPMDNKSLWLEIFQKEVSKAGGIEQIAKIYGIDKKRIMAIGNDYNDIDMLQWAGSGFITSNGPSDLKDIFINVSSNNESGFSEAVGLWLKKFHA